MILNETEVTERMNSPMNLLNRLKELSKSDKSKNTIPSIPTSKDVIENLDEKLAAGTIKIKANTIMNMAMDELKARITDTNKPAELAKIAAEMNKIVTSENEANRGGENRPQFILYAPQFNQENNYETIYSRE
jgi:hypothetical protein